MLRGEMLMKGSGTAVLAQASLNEAHTAPSVAEAIETRFGKVTIQRQNPIFFPNGLLGLPDKLQFCLSNLPSEKMARFKLLQSLDDLQLSFITLPVDLDNPIIARADLEQAAKDLDVAVESMAILLVVSVHREPSGVRLSVNARAPILLNSAKRLACQYVFASSKYEIRHMISL